MKNKIEELSKNSKMNGFQIFATIVYAILLIMCALITLGIAAISAEGSGFVIFVIFALLVLSYGIFFFFMYSLGEIIKQLRMLNDNFNNKNK